MRPDRVMTSLWQHRGLYALLLLPLSLVFAFLSAARRGLYRAGIKTIHKLPVPVVVVGNITVGGSGKTPVVLALAQRLKAAGWRPGIISRGYGGKPVVEQVSSQSDPAKAGDEPVLLARRSGCPVFVGADRVAAARALLEFAPDCNVLISDDGLQHYALARDIELAVLDGRGLGNGYLLPAGPLRECASRLNSVDAVVLNGSVTLPLDLKQPRTFQMQLMAGSFYKLGQPEQKISTDALRARGLKLAAIAGIGHPARFFSQLEALGLVFSAHAFPDHHPYQPEELTVLGAEAILMTEKDAVKCESFAPIALVGLEAWVLPVEAHIEPDLADWISQTLKERT